MHNAYGCGNKSIGINQKQKGNKHMVKQLIHKINVKYEAYIDNVQVHRKLVTFSDSPDCL